jgi:SNF2 family DNA or RNA helicase
MAKIKIDEKEIIFIFDDYSEYSKIQYSTNWINFRRENNLKYDPQTKQWRITNYTATTLENIKNINSNINNVKFTLVGIDNANCESLVSMCRKEISPDIDLNRDFNSKNKYNISQYPFLKKFQIDAIEKNLQTLDAFDGAFLFLETGLGKTVCSSVISDIYLKNGYTVIFITNKSLLGQTAESIKQFINKDSYIINGTTYFNAEITGTNLFIINYETFIRLSSFITADKLLLIFDEASKLKNSKTQLYKQIKKIIKKHNPKILLMTATPFENNLGEFFDILQVGFKFRLDNNAFKNHFTKMKTVYNRYLDRDVAVIDYYINHELFNDVFNNVWVRYKKADVIDDLPDKHEQIKLVKSDDVQLQIIAFVESVLPHYVSEMLSDFSNSQIYNLLGMLLRIIATDPNALKKSNSKILEFAKTSGYGNVENFIPPNYKSPKMFSLLEILSKIDLSKERVVIFSSWTSVIDVIKSEISSRWNVQLFEIIGSVSTSKRSQIIKTFNKRKTGILLCSDAGSHGIDLPSVNYIIEYDIPWNPAIREQRINRIYRMTSKNQKYLIDIVSELEKDVYDLVINKKINFDKSVDGVEGVYTTYSDLVKVMQHTVSQYQKRR